MATVNESVLFRKHAPYQADRYDRVRCALVIPHLVLGILGFARVLRAVSFDLAAAAAVAVLIFYAALDPRGALISLVVLVVFIFRLGCLGRSVLEPLSSGGASDSLGTISKVASRRSF